MPSPQYVAQLAPGGAAAVAAVVLAVVALLADAQMPSPQTGAALAGRGVEPAQRQPIVEPSVWRSAWNTATSYTWPFVSRTCSPPRRRASPMPLDRRVDAAEIDGELALMNTQTSSSPVKSSVYVLAESYWNQ